MGQGTEDTGDSHYTPHRGVVSECPLSRVLGDRHLAPHGSDHFTFLASREALAPSA